MTRYYILNAAGDPVPEPDPLAWAAWFELATYDGARVVAQDRDERPGAPDVLVSTVFLGLDHNFHDQGPPVLWETMILGSPHDGYQVRYASREAALIGHRHACRLVNGNEEG